MTGTPSTMPSSPMAAPCSNTLDRFGTVEALGLDEVLLVRRGPFHRQDFSTQFVDVARGQLLDVVPGRTSAGAHGLVGRKGKAWRDQVRFATLDLSGPIGRVHPHDSRRRPGGRSVPSW